MTGGPSPPPAAAVVSRVRHYGGFVLAGVLALLVDMGLLRVATDALGVPALLARPFCIAMAMIVSWAVNRTVTFAVSTRPQLREFLAFAAVSWSAQAVNYGVFGLVLLARPQTSQEVAIIAASLVSMLVAYAGFRFGVFRPAEAARNRRGIE